MKRENFICIFLAFVIVSFGTNAYSQETHIITLFVNTSTIQKPNTNASCNFGQVSTISNENFTVQAAVGDIVIWKAVSTNAPGTDRVDISSINHEGGINVFNKNRISGNGQEPEVVIGTVIQGSPGDEDKYKISFKVFNNGRKKNGTFHIDPKIQIH